jgi:sugar (pentulose or hexulose) kinase
MSDRSSRCPDLLLGIDVGTSFCKAAVVDAAAGRELAHGRSATPWKRVPTGAELDPHVLLEAVADAVAEALAGVPAVPVRGVGVTSMAEAGVALDEHGEVLAPTIAWHDARGADQSRVLAAELGGDLRFSRRTGLPLTELCSLAKLRWLSDHGAFAQPVRRWLSVAEWVVHSAGGEAITELSLASRTGLLDLATRTPWPEALSAARLCDGALGEPVFAGAPAGRADHRLLGERVAGAVLTVAGMDHPCAGLGVGVSVPGDVLDSCGTAEALVRVVAPPLAAEQVAASVAQGFTVGWHLTPGRQALLGALWSGLALREVREALRSSARAAAPASAPSERARGPAELELNLHSPERRGLTLPAGRAPEEIWDAAVQLATREAQAILERMEVVAGAHQRIVVTGGTARDPHFLAARRAIGAVAVGGVTEAGARGAALAAGVAAGFYAGIDEVPRPPGGDLAVAADPKPRQHGR